MDRTLFETLVAEAVDALPPGLLETLDNVEIVVEDWPDRVTMRQAGIRHRTELLGFYHGVPRTHRTRSYTLVLPDKISIYRGPIQMRCETEEDVRTMVEHVLRHEIAHHFGISDDRLRDLGAY
ncbi:MAG: metallopeptidase family protein [Anaerolineae bacterium]|jgi:predicted Zn-dependent protease with MMP-like domain|nr:metallopeptidase family protein [Anaerolineae bacterium]